MGKRIFLKHQGIYQCLFEHQNITFLILSLFTKSSKDLFFLPSPTSIKNKLFLFGSSLENTLNINSWFFWWRNDPI